MVEVPPFGLEAGHAGLVVDEDCEGAAAVEVVVHEGLEGGQEWVEGRAPLYREHHVHARATARPRRHLGPHLTTTSRHRTHRHTTHTARTSGKATMRLKA
jgi:hypothetical protein